MGAPHGGGVFFFKQQQKKDEVLQNKIADLIKQNREAKQAVIDQQALHIQLNQKIGQWNDAFAFEVERHKQEKETHIKQLVKKAKQRQEYILVHQVQEIVLPKVVQEVQHTLSESFAESGRGSSYIAKLVAQVRDMS